MLVVPLSRLALRREPPILSAYEGVTLIACVDDEFFLVHFRTPSQGTALNKVTGGSVIACPKYILESASLYFISKKEK